QVIFATVSTLFFLICFNSFFTHFCTNNTGRNSNKTIAHNHNNRGYNLSSRGLWRNIAITYSGKGNNTPINTHGDACKAIFGPFYQMHNGPHYEDYTHYSYQKNSYFDTASFYGISQYLRFT